MAYNKPPLNNIPFKFTTGGYTKPQFGQVPFNFGKAGYQQTADLQAAINVISVKDLGASISGRPAYYSNDLLAFIRSQKIGQKDLSAFIRQNYIEYKNLVAYLVGFKGLSIEKDLLANLYGIPPVDLQAILNVIEIRNLEAYIKGELWKSRINLGARLNTFKREYFNLSAYIETDFLQADLSAYLNIIYYRNLGAYITGPFSLYKDLSAYIKQIYHENLPAFLRGGKGFGIDINLQAYLIGGYDPGDLHASIYAIPPKDLSAYIRAFKGIQIPFDLMADIESYYINDLNSTINPIEAFNLGAYINSRGKSVTLSATIIPKVIHLKRAISVALLEHKNLKAIINFMCFASEYRSLSAYLKAIYKLDLRGFIFGRDEIGSNIVDFKCYINTSIYDVEDVIDIRFVPSSSINEYALLKLRFGVTDKYIVFNTISILFGSYYYSNLLAIVTGVLTSYDLSASLTPIFDYNYTELPSWVRPKTHEVVINIERFEAQWKRFVELMFDTAGYDNFHYFYVSGEDKIYRIDRDRHWTVWAKSYLKDEEYMVERRDVRYKYIFKMSDYSNIDEAVRDLIDRVSTYRQASLGAYINGGLPIHLDLNAILIPDVKYTWQKHLRSLLVGRLRGYQGTQTNDLSALVTGI